MRDTGPVLTEVNAPNSGHTLYFANGKLVHPAVYALMKVDQQQTERETDKAKRRRKK